MIDKHAAQSSSARRELLRRSLASLAPGPRADREPTVTDSAAVPGQLGAAERRMWRIHQLDAASVSHNITLELTIDGRTVADVVSDVHAMISSAVVLRTVIEDSGALATSPRRISLDDNQIDSLGTWSVDGTQWGWGARVQNDPHALATTPFDLTCEPPVRAHIRAQGHSVVALLSFHHLAVDDTSWPILLGAVLGVATSDEHPGATSTAAPRDAGAVERAVDHARTTWAADGLRYPLSGARPTVSAADSWLDPMPEGPGRQLRHTIAAHVVAALPGVATALGATSSALLIASSALAVSRFTGVDDFVMLVPADNRGPTQSPAEVGYCGNIVPVRFRFTPTATVRENLAGALAALYDALEFSAVDYGNILTELRRAGGRFPVTELLVSVRDAPLRRVPIPDGVGVRCRSHSAGVASYPLSLAIEIDAAGTHTLEVDYRSDLLAEDTAAAVNESLSILLARLPEVLDLAASDVPEALGAQKVGAQKVGAQKVGAQKVGAQR